MRRVLSGLAVSLIAGASLCACSASRAHLAESDPRPVADLVITAAVFGGPPSSPVFTVQGVLEDASGPVTDTVPVYALLREAQGGAVVLQTPLAVLLADGGLFRVDLPLPSAETLASSGDLVVELYEGGTDEPVGGAIPIAFAPRAWASEYAKAAGSAASASTADFAEAANTASTADSALTAGFAESAGVADALTGDMRIEPAFNAGYENYGASFESFRATRSGEMVHLSGLIRVTNGATGVFATLPEGMRPEGRHIFSATANGQYVRVDVLNDGRLQLSTLPSLGWFSVSGMSFPVAP